MIPSPLIFHISPRWKQSNTNSSTHTQQIKQLYKSKSLDTWFNQSASHLYRDDHKNTNDNSRTKDLFLNSSAHKTSNRPYITIDLKTSANNHENIKTAQDLNQILKDIQTYRNQLHDTHGSIHIQIFSSLSSRCGCNQNRSTEIRKQISQFENEFFQNDFVEYIYKIECNKNKNIILKGDY